MFSRQIYNKNSVKQNAFKNCPLLRSGDIFLLKSTRHKRFAILKPFANKPAKMNVQPMHQPYETLTVERNVRKYHLSYAK
jgi:hypothetical protein